LKKINPNSGERKYMTQKSEKLQVHYVPVGQLKAADYNPRVWNKETTAQLTESIKRYGLVDPLVVNGAKNRKGIVIGGHFRLHVAKRLGYKEMPVVYINIPDIKKEQELNLRLNRNLGDWDYKLLAEFDADLLKDVGFNSEDLDDIFGIDETPEQFDLEKELRKLDITKVKVKKGDVYEIADCRIMNGDSTVETDMLKLMDGKKADMCMTDPPYLLNYLKGKKKNGKVTEGFGLKPALLTDQEPGLPIIPCIPESINCFSFSDSSACSLGASSIVPVSGRIFCSMGLSLVGGTSGVMLSISGVGSGAWVSGKFSSKLGTTSESVVGAGSAGCGSGSTIGVLSGTTSTGTSWAKDASGVIKNKKANKLAVNF
jgi:hypothetical protein